MNDFITAKYLPDHWRLPVPEGTYNDNEERQEIQERRNTNDEIEQEETTKEDGYQEVQDKEDEIKDEE